MKKRFYFQLRLFSYLSVGVGIILVLVSFFINLNITSTLKNNFIQSSSSVSKRISSQTDQLFRQMQLASANVMLNEEILSTLSVLNFEESSKDADSYADSMAYHLYLVNYYIPFVTKVAVFNSDYNFYFNYGYIEDDPSAITRQLSDSAWYHSLIPESEDFEITAPHLNCWSGDEGRFVISLYRRIYNNFNYQLGICEIQLPYTYLSNLLEQNGDFNNLIVLSKTGELVYPYDASEEKKEISQVISQNILADAKSNTCFSNKTEYLYTHYTSATTGWTIIDYSTYGALKEDMQITQIALLSLILGVGLLFLLYLFYVTKKLTYPLQSLAAKISSADLKDIPLAFSKDEFVLLEEAFSRITTDLDASNKRLYELKIQNLNAAFLSLQAKMNPHFLYNSINIISASLSIYPPHITEDMCNKLAEMLRYSSQSMETSVTLGEELEQVRRYLDFNKYSYEEHLDFTIEVPHDMYSIEIPRLTLQPLIENSLQHGLKQVAFPWKISIKGTFTQDSFDLYIRDNGEGFSPELLDLLHKKMDSYYDTLKETGLSDELSINGMGILNIFYRLSIVSGGQARLTLRNLTPVGCEIHIHSTILE